MRKFASALICIIVLAVVYVAHAECLYNNEKHDDRYGRYPKNFTGEVTCWNGEDAKRKLMSREQWVNGEKDGPYTEYDWTRTGKIAETGTYRQGKRHGVVRKYDGDVLSNESAYLNGDTRGVQKDYKDGIVSRIYFIDDNGRVDTTFTVNAKGELTSLRCGQHAISTQVAEWCGLEGKQSTVTFYDDGGRVSTTSQYLWGLQHGTRKEFTRDGKLKREELYEKGQSLKDGKRSYDKQGALLVKTDCDDTRTTCTETNFFDGGQQIQTVNIWKAGKKNQEIKYYQNGKKKQELTAEGDDFKYRIVEYYDTGPVLSKGTYMLASEWYWQSYVPDGLIETFYDDGKPWRRENYKSGRHQGQSVTFWEREGHRFRSESDYDKDHLVRQKLFADDKAVEESEYLPDGSIKKRQTFSLMPGST